MKALVIQPHGVGEAVYTMPALRGLITLGYEVHAVIDKGNVPGRWMFEHTEGIKAVHTLGDSVVNDTSFDVAVLASGVRRLHSIADTLKERSCFFLLQ